MSKETPHTAHQPCVRPPPTIIGPMHKNRQQHHPTLHLATYDSSMPRQRLRKKENRCQMTRYHPRRAKDRRYHQTRLQYPPMGIPSSGLRPASLLVILTIHLGAYACGIGSNNSSDDKALWLIPRLTTKISQMPEDRCVPIRISCLSNMSLLSLSKKKCAPYGMQT